MLPCNKVTLEAVRDLQHRVTELIARVTQTRATRLLLPSSQYVLGQPLGRWQGLITSDLGTLTHPLACDRRDHCECRVCHTAHGVARCLYRWPTASYRIWIYKDQPMVFSSEGLEPALCEAKIHNAHSAQGGQS